VTADHRAHRARGAGVLLALLVPALLLPGVAQAARAYVSNEDEHTVSVIDTQRLEVTATIPVGKRPRGLKLSRDGSRLYVAVSGLPKCPPSVPDEECAKLQRDLSADGIAAVDTHSLKVVQLYKAGSDPEQFDVSREGRRLFVSNEDSATLTVLDLASGSVVTRIPVGREPEGVRVAPNGAQVLVTSETDDAVSLIDTHLLQPVRTLKVGHRPRDAAFTPDGRFAYVTAEFDASVYRVGLGEGGAVEKILALRKEARPMGVLLDAPQQRLYVSTGRGGTIAVIALADSKLISEVAVGARPWGIALSADHRRLFSANGSSNDVSVIDTESLKVIKKIPVGRSPWGVVIGH
jgi:PQQ-dependent catabolism-associated beta-propeller protein